MWRTAIAVALFLSCCVSAETLRIRCKYTFSTWTVATLTGLTFNEEERDKIVPAPLDITKTKDGAGAGVEFRSRPRPEDSNDVSNTHSVVVAPAEAKQLADAFAKFPALVRQAQTKRENAKTEIVNIPDGGPILMLISENSGRKVFMEFAFGQACFVVGKNEAEKLAAAIRKAL